MPVSLGELLEGGLDTVVTTAVHLQGVTVGAGACADDQRKTGDDDEQATAMANVHANPLVGAVVGVVVETACWQA